MKPLRHASSHVCVRALAEAQHSKAAATEANHAFLIGPVAMNFQIVMLPSLLDHLGIKLNLNWSPIIPGSGRMPKSCRLNLAPINLALYETMLRCHRFVVKN